MKLTKDFINQIKDANPIEEVVQQFMDDHGLPLQRSGGAIHAHHHIWRHASNPGTALYVTSSNQMWFCFSCQKGGDVIHLVQSFLYGEDYNLRDVTQLKKAIQWLADRCNISYSELDDFDPDYLELSILYNIYGDFIDYCVKNAFSPKRAEETYALIHERYPLTDETIKQFRVCYFDRKWTSAFYKKMLEKYSATELIGSGLWQDRNGEISCTFQNRIIIPYLQGGNVVYLIGRETKNSGYTDEQGTWYNYDFGKKFKKLPEYDPERPNTHCLSKLIRNDYVFGHDAIKKGQDVIITEGVGDCLVLLQAGYNAISPVTTSFKNEMLEPVSRKLASARRIYICNDNEESEGGTKGAFKMHNFFLGKGLDAKIVTLPRPEGISKIDVADYFREHTATDFDELLSRAESIIELEIQKLSPSSPKLDVERVWDKILNLDSFERDTYQERLAKQIGKKSAKKLQEWFGSHKQSAVIENLVFDVSKTIVPAMDLARDELGTKTLYTTIYIPVRSEDVDGTESEEIRPHLFKMEVPVDGKYQWKLQDLAREPLSAHEMGRLPDPTVTFNRWRLSEKYPYSFGNFIKALRANQAPSRPEPDAVFHQLFKLFDTYFWYPHDYEKLIQTLYILMTYFFQLFPALPGLHLTGPPNSGKSNSMKIAQYTAFNAVYSLNVKEAFMFRWAHETLMTCIIDENEKLTGEEASGKNDEILALLRSRYKKGASVPRTEKQGDTGHYHTKLYETYGPTYIGCIAHLENALATRMIIIECLTKDNLDSIKSFSSHEEDIQQECQEIMDKLYTLMCLDFHKVWHCYNLVKQDPRLKHIKNREEEKWFPLFTIALWIDMSAKHTKKSLFDELIPVQKEKEQLRRDAEISNNKELVVLEMVYDILVNRKGQDNRFKVLDIGDGQISVPTDAFFSKLNEVMKLMSLQKYYDMHSRPNFENILRKTQVWGLGEGIPNAAGRIVINTKKVLAAINRIKGI
jgi:DNA primase